MTQETKHTPTPWYVKNYGTHWNNPDIEDIAVCYGDDDEHICDTVYEEADAAFIVRAVNSHEDLISALQEIHDGISSCMGDPAFFEIKEKAAEALAKARGEA